jgi:hypothetical protein
MRGNAMAAAKLSKVEKTTAKQHVLNVLNVLKVESQL